MSNKKDFINLCNLWKTISSRRWIIKIFFWIFEYLCLSRLICYFVVIKGKNTIYGEQQFFRFISYNTVADPGFDLGVGRGLCQRRGGGVEKLLKVLTVEVNVRGRQGAGSACATFPFFNIKVTYIYVVSCYASHVLHVYIFFPNLYYSFSCRYIRHFFYDVRMILANKCIIYKNILNRKYTQTSLSETETS